MKTLTKEAQSNITPALALKILKEGNKRFLNNATINRDLNLQVEQTSTGQYPFACILGCMTQEYLVNWFLIRDLEISSTYELQATLSIQTS